MASALVLGGGGLAGIAWELGLLLGLRDAGVDVTGADVVVGTSAGSVVGTLVALGADLGEMFGVQTSEAPSAERSVDVDLEQLMAGFASAIAGSRDPQGRRARVGRHALTASDVPESERLDIIGKRLPSHEWPERDLRVTAIDTATGERVVFTRDAGVDLVPAVAASCAVPGVWPPVSIGGTRYMDGGIGSIVNLDVASGCDRVLVLAPFRGQEHNPLGPTMDEEVAGLEAAGSRVLVVDADARSVTAFGPSPLDAASRAPSARAGRQQAPSVVDAVRALWQG
jgi:NTE family protein